MNGRAKIVGGALKVDTRSKQYLSRTSGSEAKARIIYFPGNLNEAAVIAIDVTTVTSGGVLTISRRADASMQLHPTDVIGFESKFGGSQTDRCEPRQMFRYSETLPEPRRKGSPFAKNIVIWFAKFWVNTTSTTNCARYDARE